MKIEKTMLTKLEAEEGKILVDKEGYGAKLIYLGITIHQTITEK